MRVAVAGVWMTLAGLGGCGKAIIPIAPTEPVAGQIVSPVPSSDLVGFDRNDYPGDDQMYALKKLFAYTGFWLTPPPGEKTDSWVGKRTLLRSQGYGFLVLANGRFDKQIKAARVTPADLGKQDAAIALAAARTEGFPKGTIIFLDQEEGGRLLDEQAGYLFGWTEAVAASEFKPGVYASGQSVPDGPGAMITTIQDIREHIAKNHLHPIAMWAYQDACTPIGPAPGCTITPPSRTASGTPDIVAWQYAQSPRRTEVTASCARTYAADGNCYPPGSSILIDLNVSGATDPSHGR